MASNDNGEPIRLSPLFTWRSVIASEAGPKDVTLELEGGETVTVKGSTQRWVAIALSLHMSERGDSCFPPIALLVTETELGERTVQRALRALEREGWLEVRQGGTWRGRKVANTYRAAWPQAYLATIEDTGVTVTPVGRKAGVTVTGNGRHPDGVGRKDLATKTSARAQERLTAWLNNVGAGYADAPAIFHEELVALGVPLTEAEREELRLECLAKLEAAAARDGTDTSAGEEQAA